MAALGFFVAVLPFTTIIGFRSGLMRPFVAALALVLLFLPFKARAACCVPDQAARAAAAPRRWRCLWLLQTFFVFQLPAAC